MAFTSGAEKLLMLCICSSSKCNFLTIRPQELAETLKRSQRVSWHD